ncbi:hypothetical protein EQG49_00965 [Periweissella cryptocerci]|uniref:Uncharacterized protein n=1 Tax=Periweissella cryptocerci TaxID=2506420 RepID=A0A4V1AID5_9LACO|nr:hypothetical protein [Periweissella cryptocerci]QBO35125.1 hypothetical protein EQG49_00965 [Periweissella cryptocerci]
MKESNTYIGVKLAAVTGFKKVMQNSTILLKLNPNTVGEFDEKGQLALYTDKAGKVAKVVVYTKIQPERRYEEVMESEPLIAFTNSHVSKNIVDFIQKFLQNMKNADKNENHARELLLKIKRDQDAIDENVREISRNVQNAN